MYVKSLFCRRIPRPLFQAILQVFPAYGKIDQSMAIIDGKKVKNMFNDDMFYRNHVLQKSLRSILTIFTGNWNTEQRRKREDVKLPGNVINRSEDQNVEWVEALQYIVIIYRLAFFISHRWLPFAILVSNSM
jgi:hypothetical protein